MLLAARLHFNWCKGHLSALRSPAERYGAKRGREGERLRRVLFRGRRVGGFGLLRDLHDLLGRCQLIDVRPGLCSRD
jgi:hypothetical protein